MSDQDTAPATSAVRNQPRRHGVRSSPPAPSLAAAGAFAGQAAAQGDAELARVQGARRILIKGGVVLTLDRAVGDFASADVLIEDGKIREVRPDIAAGDAAVVDGANRIVMPGFIDTHHHFYQGILRNILSNGLLNPDYSRDISNALTAPYQPRGRLCRHAGQRARHDRHGHDRRGRHLAGQPHARAQRRRRPRAAGVRAARGLRLFARRRARARNIRRIWCGCGRPISIPRTSC